MLSLTASEAVDVTLRGRRLSNDLFARRAYKEYFVEASYRWHWWHFLAGTRLDIIENAVRAEFVCLPALATTKEEKLRL